MLHAPKLWDRQRTSAPVYTAGGGTGSQCEQTKSREMGSNSICWTQAVDFGFSSAARAQAWWESVKVVLSQQKGIKGEQRRHTSNCPATLIQWHQSKPFTVQDPLILSDGTQLPAAQSSISLLFLWRSVPLLLCSHQQNSLLAVNPLSHSLQGQRFTLNYSNFVYEMYW